MAKKQTRRSVSVNRTLYELAKVHAEHAGVPLSQFTESALRVAIGNRERANTEIQELLRTT